MKINYKILSFIFSVGISFTISQPAFSVDKDGNRIGLALSGGAARGLSHIGVIKALQEQGIEVDAVAGTSMGAIIGAMYASGYSVEQMYTVGTTMDWGYGLTDKPPRDDLTFRRKQDDRNYLLMTKLRIVDGSIRLPAGLIGGQNLDLILQDVFATSNDITDFNKLKIPYRAVATNLETGEAVIMDSGSLNTAVRASMSIPGMLAPVMRNGLLLADGGMAKNLPIDVVRSMNVDRVIAVDIGTPLADAEGMQDLFSVSGQVTTFLTIKNAKEQIATLSSNDVLLQPDLGEINSLDFDSAEKIIDLGYQSAMAQAEQLKSFSKQAEPSRYELDLDHAPTISSIDVENESFINIDALKLFIKQPIGQPFDKELLQHNINTLYGLEYFSSIDYRLIDDNKGGKVLHLIVKSSNRLTNFLRFGFYINGDFKGYNYYNISATYNKTGLSRYGAEWFTKVQLGNNINVHSELFAPLNYESPYYLLPKFEYIARDIPLYDDELENEELQIRETRVSLGLYAGLQLSNFTDFNVGVVRAKGNIDATIGTPEIDEADIEFGYVESRIKLDSEDNVNFPTSGSIIDLSFRKFDPLLGSDQDYYEADALLSRAFTKGSHTLITRARAARSDGEKTVPTGRFFLGGLGQLSGFSEDNIITQNNDLFTLQYLKQLNKPLLMFDARYYFIGSLEYGRAWNNTDSGIPFNSGDIYAGSIGAAMDSAIGPIILAYGFNSNSHHSLYFSIGRPI